MNEGIRAGLFEIQTTSVSVTDLSVDADIGIHEYEIGRRQALIVDVTLSIDAVGMDDIAATIDYCDIVALVRELATKRIRLIETFAQRLAEQCLLRDAVRSVEINVRKPGALTEAMASTRIVLAKRFPPCVA